MKKTQGTAPKKAVTETAAPTGKIDRRSFTKKTAAAKPDAPPKADGVKKTPPAALPPATAATPATATKPLPPAAPPPKSPARTAAPKKNTSAAVTTLVAITDVGWGNKIFVRGEGAGLSWEYGIPLDNRSVNEWVWVTDAKTPLITFKFVLNDIFWEQGENRQALLGEIYTASPLF
ncbi:MAG: hypothetical protein LBT53_00365 [Puniceicoccales bacterium]|jgi:hypothetical protein|nr:hypothetical protein [Puniceicoccales bacterium]